MSARLAVCRTVMVDPDPAELGRLADALAADPRFEVLGRARGPAEALALARSKPGHAHLILLDEDSLIPDADSALGDLVRLAQAVVAVMSPRPEGEAGRRVLAAGAAAYFAKPTVQDRAGDLILWHSERRGMQRRVGERRSTRRRTELVDRRNGSRWTSRRQGARRQGDRRGLDRRRGLMLPASPGP